MVDLNGDLQAEEIASGFGFLEGPRWREGLLWVSDFHRRQVFTVNPSTGETSIVFEVPGQPSGLGFTPDGRLNVVSMLDRKILQWDGHSLSEIADLSAISPHPINDMVMDSQGRMYISAFGCNPEVDQTLSPAPLTSVDPDGRVTVLNWDMTFPNGVAISPDETRLYAADQFACRLAVYDIGSNGDLHLVTFVQLPGSPHESMPSGWASRDFLPDGIAVDSMGNIWVADCNASRVAVVDKITNEVEVRPIGNLDQRVYAVAVDPADHLYACVAPRVETWDVRIEYPSRLIRCVGRK